MRPISSTSNVQRLRPTEVKDLIDACRFAYTLMKQLPLSPLLAAFVVSLTLGTIPAALAFLCTVIRSLSDWYRGAVRAEPNELGVCRVQSPNPHDAKHRPAASAIVEEPIASSPFDPPLEFMEPL
jgi:hypothetical protein